jgi:ankyrin repeat protein
MKKITLYATLLLLLPATCSLHAMSLWDAAQQGDCVMIEKLILQKEGIDINQADTNGYTPLYLAAKNGHTKVVELLLKRGADINKADPRVNTPLYWAAISGHTAVVQLLLDHGADINKADYYDNTPLIFAVISGHTAVVQLLLDHGADTNKTNPNGFDPLYWAAIKGNTKVVRLLLYYGADINKANYNGKTPLAVATPEAQKTIKDFIQKQVIMLLLGHHARCGANSLLTQLPPFVLQDIARLTYIMTHGK